MKKSLLFLFFITFFSLNSLTQVYEKINYNIPLYPFSLQIETLNSSGFLGTLETPVSNALSGNPANLINYEKISLGISYQFSKPFKHPYLSSDRYSLSRSTDIIPQSFGIIYPFDNKWTFGAGFNQVYSNLLESSLYQVTTIQNPEGNGEFYKEINETRLFKYSLSIGYKVINLITESDKLAVSVQFDIFHLKQIETYWHARVSYQKIIPSFSLGLNYQVNENWQFGLYGTPSLKFKGTSSIDIDAIEVLYDPIPDSSNYPRIPGKLESTFPYQYDYPAFIAGGYSYDSKSFWKSKMEFGYRYWHSIYPSQKNELIFSGTMIFRLNEALNFSTGIYISDHQVDLKSQRIWFWKNSPNYTRNYLLLGVNYKYEGIIFDGVIADNQLLEPTDPIRTTQYKFGIGYAF